MKFKTDFSKSKLLLILLIVIAVVTSFISVTDGGDFDVYLNAAEKLNNRQNIYGPPFIKGGLQYYYSVLFALLLAPFTNFIFITEFIWLLLSYYWLYRIWQLSVRYFQPVQLSQKSVKIWYLLVFLLALQFIMYNVSVIQVTFFLLWAILESMALIEKRKHISAGLLLALAINIKIMPLVVLPYLFYRGHIKALVTAGVFTVLFLFVPALFIGADYNNFLLEQWWLTINPQNKEHMLETDIGPHSLAALVPVYITETVGDIPFRRHFLSLSRETAGVVLNVSRLLLLGLSLFYLKSKPFSKEENLLKKFRELSYFLLLVPLLLPHQQKYAFLFAIPMVMYILYFFLLTRGTKGWLHTSMLVCFILTQLFFSPLYGSDIIGRFLFRWTQHFRLLTIATLLLIPVSLYCNPDRLRVKAE